MFMLPLFLWLNGAFFPCIGKLEEAFTFSKTDFK